MIISLSILAYVLLFVASLWFHNNKSEITFTIHIVIYTVLALPWIGLTVALAREIKDWGKKLTPVTVFFLIGIVALMIIIIYTGYRSCCVWRAPSVYSPANMITKLSG